MKTSIIAALSMVTVNILRADIVYNDPVVLDGDWNLTPSEHVYVNGGITGTGDIRYNATDGGLGLLIYGANTAVGNIYVNNGNMYLFNPAAAGSGAIHVDGEDYTGQSKCVQILCSTTLANTFYLGTESGSGYQPRLISAPGAGNTVTFNGAINAVDASKFQVNTGSACFNGGIVGAGQLAVSCLSGADLAINSKPLDVGGGQLMLQNPGTFRFNVAGNTCGFLCLASNARMVCGVDNCFSETPFTGHPGSDGENFIDLNGHDLALGNLIYVESWGRITVVNSCSEVIPTFSINQTSDANPAILKFDGSLNFVKRGAAKIGLSNEFAIGGNLTIQEGELSLSAAPAWPLKFAETVTLAGGTLDLGGQVWRCGTLVQNGGMIINGTLYAATNVINVGNNASTATIAGDVELNAADIQLFPENLASTGSVAYAHTEYGLPNGTVLYLPFDSAETLTRDYSASSASIIVRDGNPAYAKDGKCRGCLYLDGESALTTEKFPITLPVGNAARTIGMWFKLAADAKPEATMLGWGVQGDLMANVVATRTSWTGFFPWGFEGVAQNPPDVNINDGAWHHYVVVWDGTELRHYVDGYASAQTPEVPFNTAYGYFAIGTAPSYSYENSWFKGWIDEIFVLNRSASAEEVAGFYAAPFTREDVEVNRPDVRVMSGTWQDRPAGAVAIWSFDDTENMLVDATGKGHTLSVGAGDPKVVADVPATGGNGALYLDGSSYLELKTAKSDIPVGNAPRTVAMFMKTAGDRDLLEDAMVSLGLPANDGYAFSCACRGESVGCGLWGAEKWHYMGGQGMSTSWHSFVVTWDGSKAIYYWDGEYLDELTAEMVLQTTDDLRIGYFGYERSFYKGYLDEIALYGRALDAKEVELYHVKGAVRRGLTWPNAAAVDVSSDSVLALEGFEALTISSLSGMGTIRTPSLTVESSLKTGTTVVGDLTMANGIRILPNNSATVVSGQLSISPSGTVAFPSGLPKSRLSMPLVKASAFIGIENLGGWSFEGQTKGWGIELVIRDGTLFMDASPRGFALIIR